MAATVTIDKAYFETLLRRAEFHTSGRDLSTPFNIPTVSIPKVDHDNLLQIARDYGPTLPASLKSSLYRGGITSETLEVLINGENTAQVPSGPEESGNANQTLTPFASAPGTKVVLSHDGDRVRNSTGLLREDLLSSWANDQAHVKPKLSFSHHNSSGLDEGSFTPNLEKDDGFLTPSRMDRPHYEKVEQRTVLIKGLGEKPTHKEVTGIVRGGTLLDIYMRLGERSASVSFVEGKSAQDFFQYSRRNDIYASGKRVEVVWNDRQFILPGYVANKIGIGATRNLVIRNVHPNITEERIREDLDHIHNLVVVGVTFGTGDCFIELNSIHNALFARSCMMSRGTYKGMRIEWSVDECARPLPKTQPLPRRDNRSPAPPKKVNAGINRFQMLGLDDTEGGSSDEDDDNHTRALSDLSRLQVNSRSPWNVQTVTA